MLRDLILEEIEGKVASSKIVPPSSHFEPSVVEVPDNSANLGKTSTDEVPSLASSVSGARDVQNHDVDSGIDTSDSCDEKKNKPFTLKAVKRQHSKNLSAST